MILKYVVVADRQYDSNAVEKDVQELNVYVCDSLCSQKFGNPTKPFLVLKRSMT